MRAMLKRVMARSAYGAITLLICAAARWRDATRCCVDYFIARLLLLFYACFALRYGVVLRCRYACQFH